MRNSAARKLMSFAGHALLIVLWVLPLRTATISASTAPDSFEKQYLYRKSIADYRTARQVLYRWSLALRDPTALEVNIFRMEELLHAPGSYPDALEHINALEKENPAVRGNPAVHARLDMLRNLLCLKSNKPDEAREILSRLGYRTFYKIVGPFSYDRPSDFEIHHQPETGFDQAAVFRGKYHTVSWMNGAANLRGEVDINELEGDTSNSLYYLTTRFTVAGDGACIIHLGKTGYTDLYIDGVGIFTSRRQHGYCADQYRIKVFLPKGTHHLLVKTGSADHYGIRISLRITDIRGTSLDDNNGKTEPNTHAGIKHGGTSFFPALSELLGKKTLSDHETFTAAYLLYRARLNSKEDHEAERLFSRSMDNSNWKYAAAYYLGMMETEHDKKGRYLRICQSAHKGNVESRLQLSRLRLSRGFFFEAYSLMEEARSLNPSSPAWARDRAEFFISRGWHQEALKTADELKSNGFEELAAEIRARVHLLDRRYDLALIDLSILLAVDPSNRQWLSSAVDCYEKTGNPERAVSLIESRLPLFPRDVRLRTTLARLIKTTRGDKAAIPIVTAAMGMSPYNRNLCLLMSNIYRTQGYTELGMHYLRKAYLYNPGDFSLKQYYDTINEVKTEVDNLLANPDDESIQKQVGIHGGEPALVLLDQYVVRIHSDGSHERWVHKVVKIQDESSIEDFTRHYIVFNPATDRIENIRLAVTTSGSTVESSRSYTRSLSDPESRLYYDLKVKIISSPPISRGSIIDLSYRLKSNEGRIYRGYFGHSFTAGSEYRTIKTNIIVSCPFAKPLYCYLRGISKNLLKKYRTNGRFVYHITLNNLAPYLKEPMMPHQSEFQPMVILSSHRDWRSVHQWYEGLVRTKAVLDDDIKTKLASVVGRSDSTEEKIKKIFTFVATEIRYVGFELGLGGLEPRSADVTFRSGMGDCKDVSVLLAACLREYGINAQLALIRTRDKGTFDPAIPWLGQFNHAVCYVEYGEGIFLDATAKLTGIRELPPGDRDLEAFVVDGERYRFIRTSGSFYLDNRETALTDVTIMENGGAHCQRTIIKEGYSAPSARFDFLNRKNKMDTVAAYWNDRFTGALVGAIRVLDSATDHPVSYSYGIKIPSLLHFQDKNGSLRSFLVPSNYYSNLAMLKKRIRDIQIKGPSSTGVTIRYRIPAGWRFQRVPPAENRSYPEFSARFSYTLKSSTLLEVRSEIHFNCYRISSEEYSRFRDFARFIHRKENERIILERRPVSGEKQQ